MSAKKPRSASSVLMLTLALNLLVVAIKAIYAALVGSMAVAFDAVHSLIDSTSNIVGLIALRLSGRSPNAAYPYGFRKIELFASLGIGAVVVFTALQFGTRAIDALLSPTEIFRVPPHLLVGLLLTLFINIFVAIYERRAAKRLDSAILAADAAHTLSDVGLTTIILSGQIAVYLGYAWVDAVSALLVAGLIFFVGLGILKDNLVPLLDRAQLDPSGIQRIALAQPGVLSCHRVRSRGMKHSVYVDLHVLVDSNLSVEQAHEISHRVESALRTQYEKIADIVIHVEPRNDPEEPL